MSDSFDEATVDKLCFSQEDINELHFIRQRLMGLTTKLKHQLKKNNE